VHHLLAENLKAVASYDSAEHHYDRAIAIWEKALDPEHRYVLAGLSNLAIVYFYQGKYAEFEELQKQVLAMREKTLGPDHVDVASSLNNLGSLYTEILDSRRPFKTLLEQASDEDLPVTDK
jgi:tetratricopeptide (TPR) repeat protein